MSRCAPARDVAALNEALNLASCSRCGSSNGYPCSDCGLGMPQTHRAMIQRRSTEYAPMTKAVRDNYDNDARRAIERADEKESY